MNLTSKRLVQFMAGCASLCALNASATDYVSDSFENPEGSNGWPVVSYKMTWDITHTVATNNWQAQSGDASTLTNVDNSAFNGTEFRPITNAAAQSLVLNLATEGQTLTRVLDGNSTNNFHNNGPYYVDTLIQFTPSEDTPTISDNNVKAAIFVNAISNLVVYHGSESSATSFTDVGLHIDPTQWYRLTIQLGKLSGEGVEYTGFKVYVNGVCITNAVAATDDLEYPGTWFINPSSSSDFSSVSFQGTGMIDELVVTDSPTPFKSAAPTAILLTLAFNDTYVSVSQNGSPISNGGTVESGSTIAIQAANWYEIASVTGTGDAAFSGTPAPGALVGATTGTVSATSVQTLTITAQVYSASSSISTGLGTSAPANKVAAWAVANNLSSGSLTSDMYDDYLFNVATNTNPKLVIASISTDSGANTCKVVVTNTANVAFNTINGSLLYKTTDSLSTAFSSGTSIPLSGTGTAVTNTVSLGDAAFFKFSVE